MNFDMIKSKLIKPANIKINTEDIIHLRNTYNDKIIKCKLCNCVSGSLITELTHTYNCKYYVNRVLETIKYKTSDVIIKNNILFNSIFPVYQKEYYIATVEHPIIGTYGLGPCICIIMRDPISTKTMLAHIDSTTIEPLNIFFSTFNDIAKIDVYIVGGDNSSNDLAISLLDEKYNIKLIWLIDNDNNDISIDSRNGDIYLNLNNINNFMDIPLRMSNAQILLPGQLNKIIS
jgi:hypothetical protein